MTRSRIRSTRRGSIGVIVLAGLALAPPLRADEPTTSPAADEQTADHAEPALDVLVGRWVRPDGGYTVTIDGVAADGRLDASYANPHPLPFSKAEASIDGGVIRVFFEITAGGYAGSTYTLIWNPQRNVLEGVYYQAVAKQAYDIFFERAP